MRTLASIAAVAPDALLALMAEVRADTRVDKVDLGVGVYRDDKGRTPIMGAVHEAEKRLVDISTTKMYEGPRGNPEFAEAIRSLIEEENRAPHTVTFAAPGGCGALAVAMGLLAAAEAAPTLWISTPTWPNHPHIASATGLKTRSYPYAEPTAPSPDVEQMFAALKDAAPGDAVLLQGPCHNPTGIDLSAEGWKAIAAFLVDRGLIPLIDIAYHGFAASLEQDLVGVRTLLDRVPEALVSYSCSKNFGLYRDRCGALFIQTDNKASLATTEGRAASVARASYSMPPAHGPAIVAAILSSPSLQATWRSELAAMRDRMIHLRSALADSLSSDKGRYDPTVLKAQNGMFSQLPLTCEAIDILKRDSIYIPASGRINVAGLAEAQIARVAESLSSHL